MKIFLTVLITNLAVLSAAFYSMTCRAEVVEYDFEIVIFEDSTNRYSNSEQWPRIEHELLSVINNPDNKTPIKIKNASDATHPDKDRVVNVVENEISSLAKHITRLKKSSRYNVLTHKAWRQTGLDAESAIDVYIDSTEKSNSKTSTNPEINHNNDRVIVHSNIKGNIKIILGRYLHIYTDMIYQKKEASPSTVEPAVGGKGYKEYLIKSHRRMRSNELHYIDHPLVGILVMAHPVEQPPELKIEESEAKAETAAGSPLKSH